MCLDSHGITMLILNIVEVSCNEYEYTYQYHLHLELRADSMEVFIFIMVQSIAGPGR